MFPTVFFVLHGEGSTRTRVDIAAPSPGREQACSSVTHATTSKGHGREILKRGALPLQDTLLAAAQGHVVEEGSISADARSTGHRSKRARFLLLPPLPAAYNRRPPIRISVSSLAMQVDGPRWGPIRPPSAAFDCFRFDGVWCLPGTISI
jgi:hypothetical protein